MTLLIDSHFSDVNIVLYHEGRIILNFIKKDVIQTSKYLISFIKEVTDNYSISDIVIVNGPGSFTGVRLSVTVAKTLAMCYQIPIRTIDTLKCFNISSNCDNVSLYDKNGYYVATFNNNNLIKDYKYVSKKDFELLNIDYLVNPSIDYLKVIEYCLKKDPVNYHRVNPLYIKEVV